MKREQTIKILIIDDDIRTTQLLRMYLEREGWEIDDTRDGRKGVESAIENEYQLIILGWTMHGLDGIKICKKIREGKSTPIIMLTLRGDEFSKLRGFEVGVDDYIIKPFSPREMVYRIKALLRRSSDILNIPMCKVPSNVTILSSEVTIDHDAIRVLVGKEEVKLRRKEYELLHYLARTPNRVFSREELLKNVWNYDIGIDNRTVDTHIRRLRKKLAKASLQASKMIVTHWGVGYTLEVSI